MSEVITTLARMTDMTDLQAIRALIAFRDAAVDEDEMADWSDEARARDAEWRTLTYDQKVQRLLNGMAEAQAEVDAAISRGELPPGTNTKDLTDEQRRLIFPEDDDED